MTRLTRLALNNASITFLLMAAVVVAGLFAAYNLNQELVPDVQPPQATIVVVYPGASADEVTNSVVEPIEDAMEEITDFEVLEVSATASEGFAAVTVNADYGVTQDEIEEAIESQLEDVDLPEDAEDPEIILFNFADLPVIQVSISGELELQELQRLVEDEMVPELEKLDGVSEVTLTGDREDKVFLRLDPDRLDAEGVTVDQIRNVLSANDISFPAGTLRSDGRVTPLVVSSRIETREQIEDLVISTGSDGPRGPPNGDRGAPAAQDEEAATEEDDVSGAQTGAAADGDAAPEGPFDIPRSVQFQAAAIGVQIRDTDDLTPELVGQLEASSEELLRSAAIAIVDSLPEGGYAALPEDVLDALPDDLREELEQRAGAGESAAGDVQEEAAATGPRRRVVIVQAGESISTLAGRFGTTEAAIRQANGLDEDAELERGDVVRIPLESGGGLPAIWQVAGARTADQITPAILEDVLAVAPDALGNLTDEQLLLLPQATVEELPQSFLARQSADLIGRLNEDTDEDADEEGDEDGDAVVVDAETQSTATPSPTPVPLRPDELPADWVRLADVASVFIGAEDATTINRTNQDTSLGVLVLKDQAANTVSVVREVEDEIEELQDDVPALDALDVRTVFEQASFIETSLDGVRTEGILGGLLAVIVILIFLASLRSTLIIALSIPLSILTALLLMRIQGLTLNLLTLSGLTIAIGRVVDDSIVVLENVFRNLQEGTRKRDAIIQGTREVAAAITAATLVTVAVFLPLGYIGGLTRQFFLPFALTTAYALLASLLVAVTIIPLLARSFLSPEKIPETPEDTWLQSVYTPALEWALDHRAITLVLSLVFFLASLGLARFIPQNFIGGFGDPALTVEFALPAGASLESTDAVARLVEDVLEDEPDVEDYETTVGRGSTFFGEFSGGDPSKAFFFASFTEEEDGGLFGLLDEDEVDEPEDVADRVRDELAELNDLDEIERRLSRMLGEDRGEDVADDLRTILAENNVGGAAADGVFDYTVSSGATGGPPSGVFDLRVAGNDEDQVREATGLILEALRNPENWEDLDYDLEDEDDADDEDDDEDESLWERLFGDDDEDDDDSDSDTDSDQDEIDEFDLPIINIDSNLTAARRELTVDVDQALALENGLSTVQVGAQLRRIFEGADVGNLEVSRDGTSERLDVEATWPDDFITDRAQLEGYMLDTPGGDEVRLGDIAIVALRESAVEITRVDGERAAIISGEIRDDDVFGITADAMSIIDDVKEDNQDLFGDPEDDPDDEDYEEPPVTVGAGVQSTEQQEGFTDLIAALPVSILIVYLIMVIEFGSLATPFVILFSLPFALTGALIALAVTQRSLSVSSLIGVLMLIGIVVTNAIVLLDFVKQLRDRGYSMREALVRGGRIRVRPIIMTALATIIALIPLSIGLTEGTLIAEELATTVIGGLLTSTLLTLVVVPVVYSIIVGAADGELFGDGDGPAGPPEGPTPPPAPGSGAGGGGATGGGGGTPEVPSPPSGGAGASVRTPSRPAPDPLAPPSEGRTGSTPGGVSGSLGTWQEGADTPEQGGGPR